LKWVDPSLVGRGHRLAQFALMKPVSSIDPYVIKKVKEKRQELGLSQTWLSYIAQRVTVI
jgi:hypothetical protein